MLVFDGYVLVVVLVGTELVSDEYVVVKVVAMTVLVELADELGWGI